jgi:hypothetical protein
MFRATNNRWMQPFVRKIFFGVLIVLLLAPMMLVFAKQKPKHLYFKKGHSSIRVRGYLSGKNDTASYLITVKANQTIEVPMNQCGRGNEISTGTAIFDPSGKEVDDDHDMQGNNGVTKTSVAGTYRIEVSPSGKSGYRGPFCIDVEVK